MISLAGVLVITALVSELYISSSSLDLNGLPCSWNTPQSLTAFCVIRDSFPPLSSWCSVLVDLFPVQYSFSNSCCTLDSSGAMRKYLSSDFSFCVIPTIPPITLSSRFSCLIPWSGYIDVNPATPLVTHIFPFTNLRLLVFCFLHCGNVQWEKACIVQVIVGKKK